MINKSFWDDVINRIDEKMADETASVLFSCQKSEDIEVREYLPDPCSTGTEKMKKRSVLAFAASIAAIICIAVFTVVIIQNNNDIAVQPLDSNDEYSYLLDAVDYTHSTKVYFFPRELGMEYLKHNDILDNKLVMKAVETYIFAGNFDKRYYIFGNIDNEDNLTKHSFDDPVGGMTGLQKPGWDIFFRPDLLKFIDDESIREFCKEQYENGRLKERVEEITDIYIVCIPEHPALIQFKDGDKVYYIQLVDPGSPYAVFTQQQFIDSTLMKDIPTILNGDKTIDGYARGSNIGNSEINITKLMDYLFDDELFIRDGNITTVYMKDMITGEKRRVCVFDSKTGEIEIAFWENDSTPKDFWNSGDRRSWFEQNDLYMNGPAAYAVMAGFGISVVYVNDIEGQSMFLSYDESSNCFTKSTDYLSAKDFGLTIPRDTVTLYSKDGKVIVPFSVRVPYAEIYTGMPIEFELKIEDNGKPVPINGKESYRFTTEIDPDTRNYIVDGISLDCEDITFNEYGYAENLTAYMTYTVDGRKTASDKIETRTDKRGFLVRNNPDDLTEEELAATNPIITKCEKRSDGAWNMTIDLTPIADENENIASFVQFIDEKNNTVVKMSNNLKENTIGTTFMFVKGEELKIDVVLFNENDEPYLTLYMLLDDDDRSFHYREKFLLTE